MQRTTKRNFTDPDTILDTMERITVNGVDVDGVTLSRVTALPGWVWSVHSKPVHKTDSCQVDHLFYVISGQVNTRDNDGVETEYRAGDLAHIPPGHDGWTVGAEPAVWIEIPH